MPTMDRHALDVLEFAKIRDLLAQGAASALGLEAAAALAPLDDVPRIRIWRQRTSEARAILDLGDDIPLAGLHDVRAKLRQAAIGGVLDPTGLREVADTLRCAANVRRCLRERPELENLHDLAAQLVELPHLVSDIERCIGDDGEVLDSASPELRRLRQSLRTLSSRVQATVRSVMSRLAADQALQDSVVTLRGGRYCVPVKTTHQGRVEGIVHDRSSTGATVFVEPAEVVRLNNELREAELAEREEVNRILRALSAMVAEDSELLESNLRLLTIFDESRMRGRFSLRLEATAPELDENGVWELRGARHPLLASMPGVKVVANDIRIGDDFRTLLVTGPNTGGKTVALKTLGLLTMMAHCGLHIPADEGSRVALCPDVFADIGDEQSLEQSLSTFGSHLKQIVWILAQAQPGSLVLLDEVGAGTDPVEGAALAQAILTALHERGCRVVATTHHGSLKAFAYATAGIENGSVEFDRRTLRPTYRLLTGIPGASHAFEIASGLGLSDEVLAHARDLLPGGHVEAADLITEMQNTQQRLAAELRSQEHEAAGVSHQRRELERERQRLRDLEQEIRAEAEREARTKLAEVDKEASRILSELRKADREGTQTEAARQRLRKLDTRVGSRPASPAVAHRPPPTVAAEDTVLVVRLGKTGRVVTVNGSKVQVQVGAMRMNLEVADLELVERGRAEPQAAPPRRGSSAGWDAALELHVRGETVDEAMVKVERFLDQALLANMPEARIVHGKGTGTLKRAVWDYLKAHPYVVSYGHPPENMGGTGVTVAKL
ncbi:MAG: endonuclease MutS2 [Armatimonadetes bacterium]|nr:endonuclease MutS2 [Armatimonadota bacterium]